LHLAARDAELNQLKMLVEQLADKVNARGDTPAERLAAVEHRVDEVATHGVRLGTTLGLAAMATHTDIDYLLTQNVHLAPNTQQAEQAGFTRAKNYKTCQSIFPEN
jgi:hypothetical protein